jgi:tRNA threonylcarbamoyladenosine biosynthesis protein TsaB
MRILALETSTEIGSVALWINGDLEERVAPAGVTTSQWLLPETNSMMTGAGLIFPQLDGIAFGAGPGSFTGLRVACACAQGLAFGAGLPLMPVGTLEALAYGIGAEKVVACLDARMQEVYFAAYHRHGDILEEVLQPGLYAPEDVPLPGGLGWHGGGSGFSTFGQVLRLRLGNALDRLHHEVQPSAGSVARLAAPRLAEGKGVDPWEAVPIYLRDKVALKVCER